MLLQLRDYIVRERVASLQQLTREFHIDATAIQPMLTLLIKKGLIFPTENKARCQSPCGQCKSSPSVFYRSDAS